VTGGEVAWDLEDYRQGDRQETSPPRYGGNRIDSAVTVGEDRPSTILVLKLMPGNFWRGLIAPSATAEGHIPS
jgi:hypothetical protein